MKRFISALLSFVLAIGLLAYLPVQAEAYEAVTSTVTTDWDLVGGNGSKQFNARKYLKENGTFNYHAWSQGQLPWGLYKLGGNSEYATFNNYGCLVTAFAKIAVQSGNYSVQNMDPGIMNELMQRNGCFKAGNGICNSYANTAKLIGLTYVKTISYSSIVSELKNDNNKQFIIYVKNSNGQDHYVPVNNELTLKNGSVYVDNSGVEGVRTESTNFETSRSKYFTGSYSTYQQYVDKLVGKTLSQLGFTAQTVYMFSKGGTGTTVTIESYKTSKVGITGDDWLYPAFKVTVPNYKNSKISTVGYSVYNESGVEIYNFQETYRSGVNKDGTSYKNTFFGARTDGGANMDLDTDVYNIAWGYLTDARFTPGHTYKVKGFIIFDGKRYESSKFTMSTTGSKQCSWDYGKETKSPTCTSTGIRTYTCLVCGATKTETLPITEHSFDDGKITKEPKCIEEGIITYTCSSCGTTIKKYFGGRGHTPGAAATCTTPQTCTVCGTQLKAALGHNFSGSYYFSTHPHEEYQKCTRCNAEKKTGNTKKVDGCSICYPTVTFTITYNANGGTGEPASQTKESGKALTLSSTKPTRQGYTFLGWATSAGASSAQYNAGSSFTTDANTTLYAVWRKDVVATGAQLVVGNVTGRSGSVISVPISIKNNPGIYALRFEMDIDTNIFEFVSYDCSSSVFSVDSVSGYDSATKKFKLNRSGNDVEHNVVSDGIVTVIKLKIRDNAANGTYNLTACVDAPNTISINGLVKVADGTGSVSISDFLLGDANGDGQITNTDLLFMKRYIFNKTSYPLPCPMSVVDINGDNECTNADILRVCRYIFNKDKYPLK